MSEEERRKPLCAHCGGDVEEYMPGMYYQGWKCLSCKQLTWTPQEWTTQPSPFQQMQSRIAQLEEALRFYADLNNWYEDSHEGDIWEGVWWRGVHYGRGWQLARAALSSSRASEAGATSSARDPSEPGKEE